MKIFSLYDSSLIELEQAKERANERTNERSIEHRCYLFLFLFQHRKKNAHIESFHCQIFPREIMKQLLRENRIFLKKQIHFQAQ